MQEKEKIFALDIGTRSVVGIILEEINSVYHVQELLVKEHKERAMLDGQIHDVPAVSQVIQEIKKELETRHGTLSKVCVAAAGRALKTERSSVFLSIKGKNILTKQDVLHLELSAVQQAQAHAAEKYDNEKSYYYYCVGYSVLHYRLDGEEIGSLVDQQGDEASVEIIATFLPRVVVESLIAALNRAGLEMEALTLEPIAAINVLIPPSMRRLNVALVDIGAGTSDIALTNMGTVVAYGMVPVAGDEITEALSDALLLDFPNAETAKRQLLGNEQVEIEDILGIQSTVEKSEVISMISNSIDKLAKSISNEILSLNNGHSPKAVMLVGGGSMTPELPERIAECLNLPANRVAIRGSDAIQGLEVDPSISSGPEYVTPIGIAIAAKKSPVQYITVYVNDRPVRLFEVKKLTVGDCLLASGQKISRLYGKPGMAIIIEFNGQVVTVPGEHGHPPVIEKNGEICDLDEEVSHGDSITALNGKDGGPASVRIIDFIDQVPIKTIHLNGLVQKVGMTVYRNGRKAELEEYLEDKDKIHMSFPQTIEELMKDAEEKDAIHQLKPFRIKINGKDTFLPAYSGKVQLNGKEVKATESFEDGDEIEVIPFKNPSLEEIAQKKQWDLDRSITVRFNGEALSISKPLTVIRRNGMILNKADVLDFGDEIEVLQKEAEPFIFQDLFRHVEIEMPPDSRGQFRLLKNNEDTTFYDEIVSGDDLEILWPMAAK
ncbi:cell division protein FtsA [Falsibacillus pallidus]|uniref:Cell division protein FtsA n=1 Tax=Falsibacillus pallidus TaxID=493781 RepID=A0A370GKP9_9BACI|nr:cell division protein FtsA [Falsibacillus pallidus]RDI44305.1 cell division protein FtsA [Falsibacillus pallidus]